MPRFGKYKYLHAKIARLVTVKSCVIAGHFVGGRYFTLCTCHWLVLSLSAWTADISMITACIYASTRMFFFLALHSFTFSTWGVTTWADLMTPSLHGTHEFNEYDYSGKPQLLYMKKTMMLLLSQSQLKNHTKKANKLKLRQVQHFQRFWFIHSQLRKKLTTEEKPIILYSGEFHEQKKSWITLKHAKKILGPNF